MRAIRLRVSCALGHKGSPLPGEAVQAGGVRLEDLNPAAPLGMRRASVSARRCYCDHRPTPHGRP